MHTIEKLLYVLLVALLVVGIAVSFKQSKTFIIFDGDSLIAGSPDNVRDLVNYTFPNGSDVASDVIRRLGTNYIGFNKAVDGRPLGRQIEDFDKNIAPLIKAARREHAKHIIVVSGGEPGNLFYLYEGPPMTGASALQETAYSSLATYADMVHKAGALFIDITMPRRLLLQSSNMDFFENIEFFNDKVRKDCIKDHICDAVVDLAADPRMQDPNDRTYYRAENGTHFTAAGYEIWADYTVKTIEKIK